MDIDKRKRSCPLVGPTDSNDPDQLSDIISKYDMQIHKLHNENTGLQSELQKRDEQIKALEVEMSTLKSGHQADIAKLRADHLNAMEMLNLAHENAMNVFHSQMETQSKEAAQDKNPVLEQRIRELGEELEQQCTQISLLKEKYNDLKSKYNEQKVQLDRHACLTIQKRELNLIEQFKTAYKQANPKKRELPSDVNFLIMDYITNLCLNDLQTRPLMVSRVAFEEKQTHLGVNDLIKIGVIASDLYYDAKGVRPEKSCRCVKGNMYIEVNIFKAEDRCFIEEAIKKFRCDQAGIPTYFGPR